jgi:predicted secreted hydrolase
MNALMRCALLGLLAMGVVHGRDALSEPGRDASPRRPSSSPATQTTPSPATQAESDDNARMSLNEWQRAAPGRAIRLPDDHASHPEYRLEWWYYTGNVTGDDGRAYGFQVTFFRYGMVRVPRNPSAWAVRDLYMAHVAVADIGAGRHLFADRLNRAGVHWAGASETRLEVWNEDWRVSLDEQGRHHLVAHTREFDLDLRLEEGKPPVLQGDAGYSRKGSDPGNASHYYSLTRMPAAGTLRVGGRTVQVTGTAWMDHEFGTSTLEAGTQGWDWFALQLDDGRELMLYRFRRTDGTEDPYSSGTWVAADGTAQGLDSGAFAITPTRTWLSPVSGGRYPVAWEVTVPGQEIALRVQAAIDAQELTTRQSTNVTYWEGAVTVEGTVGGRPATGRGYVELTGYAGQPISEVMR